MIKLDGNKEDQKTKYELIGIVIHIGNSGNDGHIYTYCMSPVNNKWYSYKDSKVEYILDPIQSIRGIPYLLFYQKIKIIIKEFSWTINKNVKKYKLLLLL